MTEAEATIFIPCLVEKVIAVLTVYEICFLFLEDIPPLSLWTNILVAFKWIEFDLYLLD